MSRLGWLVAGSAVLAAAASARADESARGRTGLFPRAIAIPDVDADGNADILVPASAERKVTVLQGDGRGGFRSNDSYPVAHGPTWIAAAELNGDGHVGFVTTDTGAHQLSVHHGDGRGGFRPRASLRDIHGPVSLVARDFNQDGRADLAVAQAAESQILVLPARHFLLYKADRIPDGSLVPLSIAVIGIRWGASDGRLAGGLSFLLALCILMTSLAVAVSLGIHSIGAHLRF